jgi:arabinofuranan 3-O-arabinosyltransferase
MRVPKISPPDSQAPPPDTQIFPGDSSIGGPDRIAAPDTHNPAAGNGAGPTLLLVNLANRLEVGLSRAVRRGMEAARTRPTLVLRNLTTQTEVAFKGAARRGIEAARKRPTMAATSLAVLSSVSRSRRATAASGVIALVVSAFVADGAIGDRLALFALIALSLAVVSGFAQFQWQGRIRSPNRDPASAPRMKRWLPVIALVAIAVGVGMQTWFKSGTSIATGDITPPLGTAWLGRIFEPWLWTGSNLGEPSQLSQDLPWAAVIWVAHVLGGDADAAQRIWYTVLYIGAALCALALIAALGMRPLAGLVGATVYVLNPYVVSEVNTYPVYAVALCLLAGLPAVLIAIGAGKLSMRWGALAMVGAAPLLGTAFFNPPLVGMVLGVAIATPVLIRWTDGSSAALRTLKAAGVLLPLLIAASAYWLVPAIVHLAAGSTPQLSAISSWAFTEARATLRNAFWLNAIWGWTYPEYFPYAPIYDTFPVMVAKFALPAIAFGALALADPSGDAGHRYERDRAMRLALGTSAAALFLILLSTGTQAPGNVIFDRLYQLPFGWLLREPGRFLMVVGLAYAVLAAVMTQTLSEGRSLSDLMRVRFGSSALIPSVYVPVAIATSLMVGFPLFTGLVVPDRRPSLPPAHVKVPAYWSAMAQLADSLPISGGVLVMPPDDFYQMPYTWGYYGNDSFVVELFKRRVLIPNGQGYTASSSELMSAVDLTAQSIVDRNWPETAALVTAMNTPLILVRRDVNARFPGRSIVSPDDLSNALAASPNFTLVSQVGSLDLFALTTPVKEMDPDAPITTIDTATPDLRLLSFLDPGANLVTIGPQPGVTNVVQAPPPELWDPNGNTIQWHPVSPTGWSYQLVDLASNKAILLGRPGRQGDPSGFQAAYTPGATTGEVVVTMPAHEVIANGDFAKGAWGPVGDCYGVDSTVAAPSLRAQVVPNGAPGGLPALRLSAALDSACEHAVLSWNGGSIVISLFVRHIDGAAPRLCLWEPSRSRCAPVPDLPTSANWTWYRASITPDAGTTSISLYLYSDGGASRPTVNEYSNVSVLEVASLPQLALVAKPKSATDAPVRLAVVHSSYSDAWQGSTGRHVLVDGMLNGWLIQSPSTSFVVNYSPGGLVRAATWASIVVLLAATLVTVVPQAPRMARRRLQGRRIRWRAFVRARKRD